MGDVNIPAKIRRDQMTMTHEASRPDPGADRARQYINDFQAFAKGGLTGVAKGRGVKLPEWSDTIDEAAHSEVVNDAAKLAAKRSLWAEPIGRAMRAIGHASDKVGDVLTSPASDLIGKPK
jgi:hypothetical protein